MAYIGSKDYFLEVIRGNIPGVSVVHKFGRNDAVGTSFEPVANTGVYQVPTVAASLEFVSDNAADALDQAGMHELTIIGLDANWAEQVVSIAAHATDGTTAVAITGTWLRVYRAYVSSSGVYATAAAGSHVGDITIRTAGGAGVDFAVISNTDFPKAQTEIGVYTIPTAKTGYVHSMFVSVSSTRPADIIMFQRPNADDVTTSFSGAMREVFSFTGISGSTGAKPVSPIGPFVGPCDIGFMAKVGTSTGEVDCDFELLVEPT